MSHDTAAAHDADSATESAPASRDWFNEGLTWLSNTLGRWYTTVTQRPFSLYGTAVLRIGYALIYLIYLLHELPDRYQLWGPRAAWSPAMEHQFAQAAGWYGWVRDWYTLLATTSTTQFNLFYGLAILICVLMVVGWQTRLSAVLFMLVVTAFQGRSIFLTDGGDNVLTLMAIYLVFMASGRRWSLDAYLAGRQRGRAADIAATETPVIREGVLGELNEVRRRLVTSLHNAAVLAVAFQMCLIYGAAGLWKVQGSLWQNGTALSYALRLDWFEPWPALSNFMASNALMVAIVSYVTIFVQIGFPFALFNKKLKYIFLVMLLGMHLGIAVLMGLPLFSAAMIVGDSVFLPNGFWLSVGRVVGRVTRRRRVRPTTAFAAAGHGPPRQRG